MIQYTFNILNTLHCKDDHVFIEETELCEEDPTGPLPTTKTWKFRFIHKNDETSAASDNDHFLYNLS